MKSHAFFDWARFRLRWVKEDWGLGLFNVRELAYALWDQLF